MFRELRYGVLFYLCAMIGGMAGFVLWNSPISHGPEEHSWWAIEGVVGGAIVGSVAWLVFKYTRLEPPQK